MADPAGAASWTAIVTVAFGSSVLDTIVGKAFDRSGARSETLREGYAAAVKALNAWGQYPLRIYRRVDDGVETLARFEAMGAEIKESLAYATGWVGAERGAWRHLQQAGRAVASRSHRPRTVGLDEPAGLGRGRDEHRRAAARRRNRRPGRGHRASGVADRAAVLEPDPVQDRVATLHLDPTLAAEAFGQVASRRTGRKCVRDQICSVAERRPQLHLSFAAVIVVVPRCDGWTLWSCGSR